MGATRRELRDGLVVLALGVLALAIAQWPGPPRLCWSDEIVYAATARNIATGHGALSSFYDARSIAARGYPLGDVHMPGHSCLLAAAFALLGPREGVAAVVPALAFVFSGLVLWRAARRVVSPPAAVSAAAAFYFFPSLARYASSAMAETPVLLLASLHLVAWWRAIERPTAARLAWLGLLLGLGATVRETYLALLVPSLLVPWLAPRGGRLRAGVALLAPLAAYLVLVFAPLSRSRAPYPFYLRELLAAPGWRGMAQAFLGNTIANARALAWPRELETVVSALLVVFSLLAPLVPVRLSRAARLAALYTASVAVSTVLPLAVTYTLGGWTGLRSLLLLAPAALVCLAALLDRARARRAWAGGLLAVLLAVSAILDRRLVADRQQELEGGEREARAIARAFACAGPHVVVAEEAFRYGWDEPRAVVIWQGQLAEDALVAVAARAGASSSAVEEAELQEVGTVTVVGCRRREER